MFIDTDLLFDEINYGPPMCDVRVKNECDEFIGWCYLVTCLGDVFVRRGH